MEQGKLDKLYDLLERSEQDFLKLLEVKDHTLQHQVHEKFQKGVELYTMIAAEFGNYCYLNGTDKQRNIVVKLSRGYNSLLNQMLKLLLAFLERKSDWISSQPLKMSGLSVSNQEAYAQKISTNNQGAVGSRIFDQEHVPNRNTLPATLLVSNEVANKAQVVQRAYNVRSFTQIPEGQTLNSNSINVAGNIERAQKRNETTGAQPNISNRALYNRFDKDDTHTQISLYPPAGETKQDGSLADLENEEQKKQAEETSIAIEEILKRKDILKKVSATESGFHLKQILRSLANTKKRQGRLGNEDSDFEDDDDMDFDAIQDDLVRAYDGAQRKTAKRVLKFIDKNQKTERAQTLSAVLKDPSPDYAMLEAEKKKLLKSKDDEYQKLVYTKESENKQLKERVEDLQSRLSNAITETLVLKVQNAGDDYSRNEVEKTIRQLRTENSSLKDKIERKKLKIKSLKDDIEMHNYESKGAVNQVDILVTQNNNLLEKNNKLKESYLEKEREVSNQKEEISDLKEEITSLKQEIKNLQDKLTKTIESHEEKLVRSPRTSRLQVDFSPKNVIKEQGGIPSPKNASIFKFESVPQRKDSITKQTEMKIAPVQNHNEIKKDEETPKRTKDPISTPRSLGNSTPRSLRKSTLKGAVTKQGSQERNKEAISMDKNQTTEANGSQEEQTSQSQAATSREKRNSFIAKDSEPEVIQDYNDLQEAALQNGLKEALNHGTALEDNEDTNSKGQTKSYSDKQIQVNAESTQLPADDNLNSQRISNTTEMRVERGTELDLLNEKSASPFAKIDWFLKEADLTADHLYKYLESKNLPPSDLDQTPKSHLIYKTKNPTELVRPDNQANPTSPLPKNPYFPSIMKDTANTRDHRLSDQQNHLASGTNRKDVSLNNLSTTNQSIGHNSTSTLINETELVNPNFRAKKMIRRIVDRNMSTINNSSAIAAYPRGNKEEASSFLRLQRQINSPTGNSLMGGDSSEYVSGIMNDSLPMPLKFKLPQSYSNKNHAPHLSSLTDLTSNNNTTPSYMESEYTYREQQPGALLTGQNRRFQEWEQQRELAKVKEEKELEEVYRGLQQKVAFAPRLKKIFTQVVQKNNPAISDQDLENGNFEIDFNAFKEYMINFKETHKRCGDDCPHLRRFYEKIGYINTRYRKRAIFAISVTEIDKLPKIVRKILVVKP